MQKNFGDNNNNTAEGAYGVTRGCGFERNNVFGRTNNTISSFENILSNNRMNDFNSDVQYAAAAALLYPLARGFELLMNMAPVQRQQLLSAALLYQQQQQRITEIVLKQQKLARAMVEKSVNENILNSVAHNNNNNRIAAPEDEISKSLKMFAMLTAPKNVSNPDNTNTSVTSTACNVSSIEAVMQDFANNGCVSDDLNVQMAKHNNNVDKTDITIDKQNKRNFYYNATQMDPCVQQNNLSTAAATTTTLLQEAPSTVGTVLSQYYQQQQQQRQQHQQQQKLQQHQQQQCIGLQQQLNFNFNNNLLNITSPSTFSVQQQQQYLNNYLNTSLAATAISSPYNVIDIHNPLNNNKKFMKRSGGTRKDKYAGAQHCVFCENNNEPEAVVRSHAVRDIFGKVLCPKLRVYVCPICKASGDYAHTLKYCPQKRIVTMEDIIKAEAVMKAESLVKKQLSKQQ